MRSESHWTLPLGKTATTVDPPYAINPHQSVSASENDTKKDGERKTRLTKVPELLTALQDGPLLLGTVDRSNEHGADLDKGDVHGRVAGLGEAEKRDWVRRRQLASSGEMRRKR